MYIYINIYIYVYFYIGICMQIYVLSISNTQRVNSEFDSEL